MMFLSLNFPQASTSIRVCAKSNLWTSVGSIGCPSCTTCAPRSAPRPAAPTLRATPSPRMRTACRLTGCRGCFWDSTPRWNLRFLVTWIWFSDLNTNNTHTLIRFYKEPFTQSRMWGSGHLIWLTFQLTMYGFWNPLPLLSHVRICNTSKPLCCHVVMQICSSRLSVMTPPKCWSRG